MIKLYTKSIYSLDSKKEDIQEIVCAYKEISGQYFCATYDYIERRFTDFSTSGEYKLGKIIKYFSESWQSEFLKKTISVNKRRKFFKGSSKIRFFFKYNKKSLSLIDVWSECEGYIKPRDYNELFCIPDYIESSKLVFIGKLDDKFIKSNPGVIIRKLNGDKFRL